MNKLFTIKSIIILSITILFALILLTLISFYNRDSSVSKNKKVVARLVDEFWSKGNLEVTDELIAPQYTIRHDPGDKWEDKTIDLSAYDDYYKKLI